MGPFSTSGQRGPPDKKSFFLFLPLLSGKFNETVTKSSTSTVLDDQRKVDSIDHHSLNKVQKSNEDNERQSSPEKLTTKRIKEENPKALPITVQMDH